MSLSWTVTRTAMSNAEERSVFVETNVVEMQTATLDGCFIVIGGIRGSSGHDPGDY